MNETGKAILSGASEIGVTLSLAIGSKHNPKTGAPVTVYASVRVPINPRTATITETVLGLASLPPSRLLSVRIPVQEHGAAKLKLSPQMGAERLHVLACHVCHIDYAKHLTRDGINAHLSALGLPLIPAPVQEEPMAPEGQKIPALPDGATIVLAPSGLVGETVVQEPAPVVPGPISKRQKQTPAVGANGSK